MSIQAPISEVFCEDNMVGMARYPDKFFDIAIVDPQYGINICRNKAGMGRRSGNEKAPYKMGDWDDEVPGPEYFKELFRVSHNQIIWGGNYFALPACRGFIVWDKMLSPEVSFAACEYAWTSFNRVASIYRQGRPQEIRIHPTQKPIELYRWQLAKYGNGGGEY